MKVLVRSPGGTYKLMSRREYLRRIDRGESVAGLGAGSCPATRNGHVCLADCTCRGRAR